MLKLFRRGTSRSLAGILLVTSVTTLCVYYINNSASIDEPGEAGAAARARAGVGHGSKFGGSSVKKYADYDDDKNAVGAIAAGGSTDLEWSKILAERRWPIAVDEWRESDSSLDPTICPKVPEAVTDIDTVKQFSNFEFQVSLFFPTCISYL